MNISVGIPTYNRPFGIERCLRSVLNQTKMPYEIIICDDSADKESEKIIANIQKEFENRGVRLMYMHNSERRGQCVSRNNILERANGEVIAYLDDDVICSSIWLSELSKHYSNPAVGCVGGPSILADEKCNEKTQLIYTNRKENFTDRWGLGIDKSDFWIPSYAIEVDLLRGANMSFRKEVLSALGGFDIGYTKGPIGFRIETDVMIRIKKSGYRLIYEPKALVYHIQSETGGCRISKKTYWYWVGRDNIYYLRKNFSSQLSLPISVLMLLVKNHDLPNIPHTISFYRKGEREVLWLFIGYLAEILCKR